MMIALFLECLYPQLNIDFRAVSEFYTVLACIHAVNQTIYTSEMAVQ